MKNEKANPNREKFLKSVQNAIEETGYVKGKSTTPLLKKTLLNFLELDSLERLWGPGWSLFVTYTARAMYTEHDILVSYDAMKSVVYGMKGYDKTLPTDLVEENENQAVEDDDDDERIEDSLFLATLISFELEIPTPIEVDYLFAVLGEDASPTGAEILWIENPGKYKLDITDAEAVVAMAKATASLNCKRKGVDFIEEEGKEYYDMLSRVADRCASYLETKGRAEQPTPKEETEKQPEREGKAITEPSRNSEEPPLEIDTLVVNVGTPSSMTAPGSRHSGYYGGGGASTEWTTGEIVLGVAAVAAAGAALWYGYNKLVADDFDIELSEFSIPDLDFDFKIPDFDF